ncbi:Acyltransferase 3 [Bosea sp. LC85]|uniref:acyltransferase family protein n=1 Tax=Bosea sp. LC85 TaxID=1502851 RepID=UPI0004E2D598|nr:acyltransferase [Bosea sp. LC85]KFC70987.1 Acyltransferase 3 [Bosea sp. LC85]
MTVFSQAAAATVDERTIACPGKKASPKLILVQSLRVFAALAVVFYHAQYDAESLAVRFGIAYQPSALLPWPAGVDVFFVISGFIMVHTSRKLFATVDGPRVFLSRRIARVVPIYWAIVTVYLVIGQLAPAALNRDAPDLSAILTTYLFIPFPQPNGVVHPVYALGWTLNYEMFFYSIFAGALLLQRERAVLAVAAVLLSLVAFGRVSQALPVPLAFWSEPIVLEFVFGMALALLAEKGCLLSPMGRFGLFAIALLLLHLDLAKPGGALLLPQVLAYGIPAAFLVAAAVLGPVSLAWSSVEYTVAALGDASYALYLVHPFAIRALRELFAYGGLATGMGIGAFVISAVLAAVVLALVVYRFVEKPMTQVVRGWLRVRAETKLARMRDAPE